MIVASRLLPRQRAMTPRRWLSRPASEIKGVRALPVVGSLPFLKSGLDKPVETLHSMYRDFGKTNGISSLGVPGIGTGLKGTTYYVSDPNEYKKVIQVEGKYPYGAIQFQWPTKLWSKKHTDIADFFEQGEPWKNYRSLMQKDLFTPSTAKGYIPGLIAAAHYASRGAPDGASTELDKFTARCSFDCFCSAIFGQLTQVADRNTPSDPEDVQFCEDTMEAFEDFLPMLTSPYEVACSAMGIKTKRYSHFASKMTSAQAHARRLVNQFVEREQAGELTPMEQKSYLASSLARQRDSGVPLSEFQDLTVLFLQAAVDTTGSLVNWLVLNLAVEQRAQDALFEEISASLDGEDLSPEAFRSDAALPYLHAAVRESHRLTPTLAVSLTKSLAVSADICGYRLPAGSIVALEALGAPNDPDLVENPESFMPERWLPDAVNARKGTPSEVIDHVLFKAPFSAGARMCPGSRVANLELLIIVATLVKDWRIELADEERERIQTIQDIDYYAGLTLKPARMPKLKFTAR